MNIVLESLVNGLRLNISSAKRVHVKLSKDYVSGEDNFAVGFQEAFNQQGRAILNYFVTTGSRAREEISLALKALRETLPLLGNSRYGAFQRGRIKDLKTLPST